MLKTCAHCEKRFESQRKTRLYCTDNCKQLAYYKRNGLVPSGHKLESIPLTEDRTVKDVKVSARASESFIERLNAFIEDEVVRRLAEQRYHSVDTVKLNPTVKQYFTDDKRIVKNSVDVKDEIKQSFFTSGTDEEENQSTEDALFEDALKILDEFSVKEDHTVKDEWQESFTPAEDHSEPAVNTLLIDDIDQSEPFSVKNSHSVKDESEESFTVSDNHRTHSQRRYDNNSAIDHHSTNSTDSLEPFNVKKSHNVKDESEESFTVNDNHRIHSQRYDNNSAVDYHSTNGTDSLELFNVKKSYNVKDESEKSFTVNDNRTFLDNASKSSLRKRPVVSGEGDSQTEFDAMNDRKKLNDEIKAIEHGQKAEPFKWVYSSFTARIITEHFNHATTDFLEYRSGTGGNLMEVSRSLIKYLMVLSSKAIRYELLVKLSNRFYMLVNSKAFKLVQSFPYRKEIIELQQKIRSYAVNADAQVITLRLSVAQRARLFAILEETKDIVKDIKLTSKSYEALNW